MEHEFSKADARDGEAEAMGQAFAGYITQQLGDTVGWDGRRFYNETEICRITLINLGSAPGMIEANLDHQDWSYGWVLASHAAFYVQKRLLESTAFAFDEHEFLDRRGAKYGFRYRYEVRTDSADLVVTICEFSPIQRLFSYFTPQE